MQTFAKMAENMQYDDANKVFWPNSGTKTDLFWNLMPLYGVRFLR